MKVMLTVEHDAVFDPPRSERAVWTDQGQGTYTGKAWRNPYGQVMHNNPTWWCEPIAIEGTALTVGDLELFTFGTVTDDDLMRRARARLQVALHGLGRR